MNLRRFKLRPDIYSVLKTDERKILPILEGVVTDVARLYELQLKDSFYPKRVSKRELEAAAESNPNIRSPYTYVYRDGKELRTEFYRVKFAKDLERISRKIQEAAKLSNNPSFKKYLLARANSLTDGSYKQADIAWLSIKNSNLDFSVGPFERYLDQLFFVKRAYQAHVGIIDQAFTAQAEEIKETLYATAKISLDAHHSANIPQKGVQILVEHTPVTSGFLADALFSGEHFPCDLDVMQQYGSRIIIYASQLKLKFEILHYPIFNAIFERRFASKYSKELLLNATGWNIVFYELSRQLHKFIGARERLRELYGPIDEANGFASGIQHGKYLVAKGVITQDELEAVIILHIVWMFSDWVQYQKNPGLSSYIRGNAVLLNSYLRSGALREKDGISWPNFSRIFFGVEQAANQLVNFLERGSYAEAERYLKSNGGLKAFERFTQRLTRVPSEF